ncbi:MAG TPA: TIGR01777 family oxidoreductase [Candidatus Binatia bacterium]|nr:TIGR01777 family oxidoreductase [Candidatus Binatia bacterium]
MTGASGLIGRALAHAFHERGWVAVPLLRRPDPGQLETLDAVINLAGEPIDGRWTLEKKTEIRQSRVEGTRALVRALSACRRKPRVLVSASAVGYYGDRGDEPLFETSPPGNDFLATVCRDWEREAFGAQALGIRTVVMRTGIVLARDGGALPKIARPFAFGAGGPLGSGRQFVPWIALDDIVGLYLLAIETETVRGAVNAVSPDVATNARVAQAIGAAMYRPALAPAPPFALRAMLGEFAESLLISQLVLPAVAASAGYVWREKRLETALQHLFNPDAAGTPAVLQTFASQQFVPLPVEEIFAFFSDARNLEAITPSSLHFTIKSGAAAIQEGSVIEYDLRLHGVPLSWKTLIAKWNPPHGFVDVQLRGPYALWEHEHTFMEIPGGTVIADDVTYALPFAPFSAIALPLVRHDVEAIFAYRREEIERRFASEPAAAAAPR